MFIKLLSRHEFMKPVLHIESFPGEFKVISV